MYALNVTLGRNVNNRPMSYGRWHTFIQDVERTLRVTVGAPEMSFVFRGQGEWDGVREESALIQWLVTLTPADERVEILARDLAELARHYDQDAIAFTHGESVLV